MSTQAVTIDASDFFQQMEKILKLEAKHVDSLQKTASAIVTVNEANGAVTKSLTGMISANEQATGKWIKNKDGVEDFIVTVKKILPAAAEAKAGMEQAAAGAKALAEILKKADKDIADSAKAREKAIADAKKETARLNQQEMRILTTQSTRDARQRGRETAEAEAEAYSNAMRNAKARLEVKSRLDTATKSGDIFSGVNRITGAERTRLGSLGFDISREAEGKLTSIAAKIADLGAKAKLSSADIQGLFAKVAAGDFRNIEGKFQGLVAQIQNYQQTMQKERGRIAGDIGGGAGGPPSGTRNVLGFPVPNGGHIDKLKEYWSWTNRISGTLTNLAIYRSFNAITHALTDSVGHSRELQINISLIRTLSQDAQLSTTQWANGLKEVSNATGIDVNKVAKAGYDAVSNQVTKGQGTFKFLQSAGELARTTGSEIGQAGNAIASVINSYKKDASDADDISAKLFKTIDNGRVNLGELAQGMGRINNTAHQLGVSFEEVSAYIATLTRNGLTTSEAMTSLNAVMADITNPTEKMTALLHELGYESGRSAVAIENGLTPVLTKVSKAIKTQGLEITNYFNNVRSDRGAATIFGNPKEILRDLDEIKNKSKETFAAAKEIRGESDADKLQKGLETLKNALSTSFGDVLVRLITQFVDLLAKTEDIEKSASRLFRLFATGAITVGTFVVVMRAMAVATEIQSAANLKATLTTQANTAAKVANTAATTQAVGAENALAAAKIRTGGGSLSGFIGANPLLATAGLLITGVAAYSAYKATAVDAFDKTGQAFDELIKKYKDTEGVKALERSVEPITKIREQLIASASIVGGRLTDAYKDNEKTLKSIRERIRESNDALKSGFAGALDLSRNKLKDMEHDLSRINERLRDGGKRGDLFKEAAHQSLNGTLGRYATPGQNLQLISAEITRVDGKIQQLIQKGTVESLGEADTLYHELLKMTTQFYEQDAEIQKKHFEDGLKARADSGEKIQGDQVFYYDPTRQQKTMNQLLNARNEAERIGNELLREQQRIKEDQIAKEKERLKALELAITKFENFNVHDDQGNIKKEFLSPKGGLDRKKVDTEFNSITENLKKQLPGDITNRLALDKEIKNRQELNRLEVERTKSQDDVGQSQKKVKTTLDDATGALDKGKKAVLDYSDATKTLIQELAVLSASLGDAAGKAPETFLRADSSNGPLGGLFRMFREVQDPLQEGSQLERTRNVFDPIAKESAAILAEVQKITEGGRNKKIAGVDVADPEAIQTLRDRVRTLRDKTAEAVKRTSEVYSKDVDVNSFPVGGRNLGVVSDQLKKTEEALDKALENFNNGKAQVDTASTKIQDLNKLLEQSGNNYQDLGRGIAGVVGGIGISADMSALKIQKLVEVTDLAAKKIADLAGGRPVDKGASGLLGGLGSWDGEEPVHRAYGGPVGMDQLAFRGSEEYVMNGGATQMFRSQLTSMNNMGRVPQTFNNGGTTYMGGVNINVNESRNPGGTSRDVFRAISRAKRIGRM